MFSVSILLTHFQTMPNFYYYSSDGKINVTGKELQELAKKGQILWDTVIENMAGKRTLAGNIKGLTFAETVQPKPQPTAPVPTAELSRDAAADLLRKFFKGGIDEKNHNTAPKVTHDQQQKTTPKTATMRPSSSVFQDSTLAAMEARYQEAKRQEEQERLERVTSTPIASNPQNQTECRMEWDKGLSDAENMNRWLRQQSDRAEASRKATYSNVSKSQQKSVIDNIREGFREAPLQMTACALVAFMVIGLPIIALLLSDPEAERQRERNREYIQRESKRLHEEQYENSPSRILDTIIREENKYR